LRGIRIQNIVNELQGEKIDVIQWSRDPSVFISHALSPAQPLRVELDEASATATVVVSDRSLSLAIGREGQNARLAAKLTGWKVDIKSSTELEIERMKQAIEGKVAEREMAQRPAASVQTPVAEPAERVETGIVKELETVAVPAKQAPKVPVASPEPVLAGVSNEAAELAALEAEIAAEELATAKLSAEEELALELLKTEEVVAPPEETEEEVEEVITGKEEVWKVPVASGQPQIRFAEDIQGAPVGGRQGASRRRRSGGGGGRRDNSRRPQGQGDAGRRTSASPASPSKAGDSTEPDE
jgi:N utilization substance protein A